MFLAFLGFSLWLEPRLRFRVVQLRRSSSEILQSSECNDFSALRLRGSGVIKRLASSLLESSLLHCGCGLVVWAGPSLFAGRGSSTRLTRCWSSALSMPSVTHILLRSSTASLVFRVPKLVWWVLSLSQRISRYASKFLRMY